MNSFAFGSMNEYLEATYAPTSRAGCRKCKEKIEKGQVRMGLCMDQDHFSSRQYFHLQCFTLRPLFKDIDPKSQIYKFDDLSNKDQVMVEKKILEEQERIRKGGKMSKMNASFAKSTLEVVKDDKSQSGQEVMPEIKRGNKRSQSARKAASAKKKKAVKKIEVVKEESDVRPLKKRGRSKSQPAKREASAKKERQPSKVKEESQQEKEVKRETRRGKKSKGKASAPKTSVEYSEEESSEEDYQTKSAKKRGKTRSQPAKRQASAKKRKAPKKQAKPKPFTKAQEQEYNQYFNEFMKLGTSQLKDILGRNNQPRTGTKGELAAKCADGKQLGRIPKCPSCCGGNPRFDRITGTYKCPGFMDDDEFHNCHKTFDLSEIKRDEWIET